MTFDVKPFLLLISIFGISLPSAGQTSKNPAPARQQAPDAMVRIACEANDRGAMVYINGAMKGDCPIDVPVVSGTINLRVVKQVDAGRERTFELEFVMGVGTSKRVDVELSQARLTADGMRRQEAEAKKQKDDKAAAVLALERSAEAAGPDAMYELGKKHQLGRGMPINYEQAAKWFAKAVEAGSGRAAAELGLMHVHAAGVKADEDLGLKLLKKASDLGDPAGQFYRAIDLGLYRDRNAEAIALRNKAAQGGYPEAQFSMARATRGLPESEEWIDKGKAGLRKLADEGDLGAAFSLALLSKSELRPRLLKELISASTSAADAGNAMALYYIGHANEILADFAGQDEAAQKRAARPWYVKAQALGNPSADHTMKNWTDK
ncbi:MAG: tetratricopeptide repeat protein [Polaromonas sp.]|nr:tetratricopeptide repeat protein [Polaromonas sp.]